MERPHFFQSRETCTISATLWLLVTTGPRTLASSKDCRCDWADVRYFLFLWFQQKQNVSALKMNLARHAAAELWRTIYSAPVEAYYAQQ